MADVSVRELRNRGGQVIDRVVRGEQVTITRDGQPVAQLRPLGIATLSAEALLARWRHLPSVDQAAWRRDLDSVLESRL